MHPRTYCLLTLSLTLAGLGCVAGLNWFVDPYGQYGTGCFPVTVQASRTQKIELLEGLSEAPTGLILGSSRVLKIEPSYLNTKTGLSFFNAGVNHGRPMDFLAIIRWYQQRWGTFPKMVVLGIDSACLHEAVPLDARITTERKLANVVPEFISLRDSMDRYFELTSLKQSKASLSSIFAFVRSSKPTEPIEFYSKDGLIFYRQREEQIRDGTYDFEASLNYNEREFEHIYKLFSQFSTAEILRLVKAVALLRQHNTQVYAFVTPFHPRMTSTLSGIANFDAREREARQLISLLGLHHGVHFADLTDLTSFNGDPENFVDGIHPLEKNTRLMVDRLLESKGGTQYAVQ